MITSEKNWPRYNCKCDCGKQLWFMSNNPPCSVVDAICECYRLNPFIIPTDSISKHRYRTQAKTEKIRSNIISTFTEIKRQMTVSDGLELSPKHLGFGVYQK